MIERLLFSNIISTIRDGLDANNLTDVQIKQSYQPTQQGANKARTVYLHKITEKRLGSPKTTEFYDQNTSEIIHTETQFYETVFQVNALATQAPGVITESAGDILNIVAYALQSEYGIKKLKQAGIGILRVQGITNTPFLDDRDRYEFSPSFDFTVEHEQVIVSTSEVVQTVDYNINRV